MGTSMDTAILDKRTLVVQKRSMKQGDTSLDLDFSDGRAAGTITANGQEKTISAEIGGALFADAAGSLQVLGCLPLAPGYTLAYRNFDLQRQRAKVMQLRVNGIETVTSPAGSFEAFVVQISAAENPAEKALVWIGRESRQAVKMTTVSPAMGGATMTMELMP